MQIAIDTPYVTIRELAHRTGQSERTISRDIKAGRILIRPKNEGSKEAVLVNMVYLTMEAADQAERVRAQGNSSSPKN